MAHRLCLNCSLECSMVDHVLLSSELQLLIYCCDPTSPRSYLLAALRLLVVALLRLRPLLALGLLFLAPPPFGMALAPSLPPGSPGFLACTRGSNGSSSHSLGARTCRVRYSGAGVAKPSQAGADNGADSATWSWQCHVADLAHYMEQCVHVQPRGHRTLASQSFAAADPRSPAATRCAHLVLDGRRWPVPGGSCRRCLLAAEQHRGLRPTSRCCWRVLS